MILGNLEFYKAFLLFILMPVTVIFLIFLFFFRNSKKSSNLSFLYMITIILFLIYFIYSIFLSFSQLFLLRKYAGLDYVKLLILVWILVPIIPFMIVVYTIFRYRTINSKGEKNEKKDSSC